jgi:asparagine synthase (glutamine-hydrolysing)
MFAFALWDEDAATLLLARDPYGIKPLYYADDGHRTCFASQVKAILAGGTVDNAADTAGWAGFYLFGFVPEPFTNCKAIRALPAGSFVEISLEGGFKGIQQYHSIADVWQQAGRAASTSRPDKAALGRAFRECVAAHMVADVPVGCFLSGGIDSAALLGLMSELSPEPIHAITLGFDEFANSANDEVEFATEVARHYNADHHVYRIGQRDFQEGMANIFNAMDQPSIDGVNSWFVTKAAATLGLKVAISGLGGDELMGGYSSFVDIPRWVRGVRPISRIPGAGAMFRAVVKGMQHVSPFGPPKLSAFVDHGGSYPGAYLLRRGLFMPDELASVMGEEEAREGLAKLRPMSLMQAALTPCPNGAFARVSTLESSIYMRSQLLRDVDWASMAHSVEVRVPLVDAELLRTVALAGGNFTKPMLAEVPQRPVPQQVIGKPKTGFATPIASWTGEVSAAAVAKRPLSGLTSRRWLRFVSETFGTSRFN